MTVEVVLADDHLSVRQGLRILLEGEGEYKIVGEASDGHEAIRLARKFQPDIALLDVRMPLLNGLDAARAIRKESPKTCSLLLTAYKEDEYVLDALRAGVRGYILKTLAADDLIDAIHEVLRGGIYLSPGISRTVVEAFLTRNTQSDEILSVRERQVLQLIAEGKSSKEIAGLLGLGVRTAESHRARIMKKLDIHDTAGLVRYAIRKGVLPL